MSEQSERGYNPNSYRSKITKRRGTYRLEADRQVAAARRSGKLVPGPCVIGHLCKGRIEAHHLDYRRPLVVTWLCHRHHIRAEQLAAETLVEALKRHYRTLPPRGRPEGRSVNERTQIMRAWLGLPPEPLDVPEPINVPQVRAAALAEVRRICLEWDSPDTHTCHGRFSAKALQGAHCYLRKANAVLFELAVDGNL